jgi:hypothetical protein
MTTRLKNSCGADEANLEGQSYKIHSDGFFYLPDAAAQKLEGHGGFFRPASDERPEVGSISLAEAIDAVFALDPGPLRAALIATLSAHGAL